MVPNRCVQNPVRKRFPHSARGPGLVDSSKPSAWFTRAPLAGYVERRSLTSDCTIYFFLACLACLALVLA
jgi:hypothetical protein